MNLTLYGNRESGHAYKVKLFLALAGIAHRYVPVDLETPRAERPADFRAVAKFGEVPVLVIDGTPHVQSDAILLHLARLTGRFGGGTDARVLEWHFWAANRINLSVPNLRFYRRYPAEAPAGAVAWLDERARLDLARLDEELSDRTFLAGDDPTTADIAACAYLFWLDQIGYDIAHWPAIGAWLDRIRALPGWAAPYELQAAS
ncbi:MAG: glutathione S-transferase [Rhodospirillales bacterium]|nr:glutathione S-transferase [Rhodospirillales bacterium]